MLQRKIMQLFKAQFFDLLGSLSIRELTENQDLAPIVERISLILTSAA